MKICNKCGGSAFYTRGACKECRKAYNKANAEKIKAANAAKYSANKEELKAKAIAWQKANPRKKQALAAAWRANNHERVVRGNAAWRAANPDVARNAVINRRAMKANVGGKLSKGLTERLLKLQRGKCACCGQPLGDEFHLDHIHPIALGGSNTDDNIQLLRKRCNQQKGKKHPVDFMQQRGRLL